MKTLTEAMNRLNENRKLNDYADEIYDDVSRYIKKNGNITRNVIENFILDVVDDLSDKEFNKVYKLIEDLINLHSGDDFIIEDE